MQVVEDTLSVTFVDKSKTELEFVALVVLQIIRMA